MSTRFYRLTVLVCAASWYMVGRHMPIVHQIRHHGATPHVGVLVAMGIVALLGVVALLALLRGTPPRTGSATT